MNRNLKEKTNYMNSLELKRKKKEKQMKKRKNIKIN